MSEVQAARDVSRDYPHLDLGRFDPSEDGAHGEYETEVFWRDVPPYIRNRAITAIREREPGKLQQSQPVVSAILGGRFQQYILRDMTGEVGCHYGLRFKLVSAELGPGVDIQEGPWILSLGFRLPDGSIVQESQHLDLKPPPAPELAPAKPLRRLRVHLTGGRREQIRQIYRDELRDHHDTYGGHLDSINPDLWKRLEGDNWDYMTPHVFRSRLNERQARVAMVSYRNDIRVIDACLFIVPAETAADFMEAGWIAGSGIPTATVIAGAPSEFRPHLIYGLTGPVLVNMTEILAWLHKVAAEQDEPPVSDLSQG